MRMRKKPNLLPRMEKCAQVLLTEPEAYFGRWRDAIPGFSQFHVELGCGKGRFPAETAQNAPEVLLVAIEKVPDAMDPSVFQDPTGRTLAKIPNKGEREPVETISNG